MKSKTDADVDLKTALYVLGTMTQTEARAFEEDAEIFAEELQSQLQEYGGVVELLGMSALEAEPPASVREQLNAFMATEPRTVARRQSLEPPLPLSAEFLTIRRDEGRWFETGNGMFVKPVFTDPHKGSTSYLVRFEPGAKTPVHRHPQVEECVVIEGDFHVDGKALGPGDYHCAMAGSIHDRPYTVNGALVLIIASEPYEVLEN